MRWGISAGSRLPANGNLSPIPVPAFLAQHVWREARPQCYDVEAMDARHTNGTATKAVAQARALGQGQGVSSTNLAQNENPAFVIVCK